VFGGNALIYAPINVVERELRRVELELAQLWFFALAPPAIKRILGLLSKLANVARPYAPRYYVTITRIIVLGLSGQV
jgi:hypothetical protein